MPKPAIRHALLFVSVFTTIVAIFVFSKALSHQSQAGSDSLSPSHPIMTIATSFPFLADIIQHVGKGYVTVRLGTTDMKGVRAYIALSNAADQQETDALASSEDHVPVYTVGDYIVERADAIAQMLASNDSVSPISSSTLAEDQGGYFWLSSLGGREVASFVARTLGTLDPTHSVFYFNNAYEYEYNLNDVGSALYDQLQPVRATKIIVTSPSWDLFLGTFDIHPFARIDVPDKSDPQFSSAMQAVAGMLKNHPDAYVLADESFPLDALDAIQQKLSARAIVVHVYGSTTATSTPYVDFLKGIVAQLMQDLP